VLPNQIEFPASVPVLELFLPLYRVLGAVEKLGVDEFGEIVLFGETLHLPPLVLPDASPQMIRHADVDHRFPAIHQYVDPVLI